MSSLMQKWNELPRAAKWLAYLVLFVGVFFGVGQPLLSYYDRTSGRAASLELALNRARDLSSADSSDGQVLSQVQSTLGKPLMPGSSGVTAQSFRRVVDGILDKNHVSESSNVSERKVAMSSTDAGQLIGVGPIDRVILEVTFEGKQEDVIAVLTDLERAPEVAAISRVRIDRSGRDEAMQMVRATIAPEAWIATNSNGTAPAPVSQPRSSNPNDAEVMP